MRTLEELRVEIDRIDQQMVQLFEERMQVVAEVMAVKKAAGLPILDASREEAVVAKNTARFMPPSSGLIAIMCCASIFRSSTVRRSPLINW